MLHGVQNKAVAAEQRENLLTLTLPMLDFKHEADLEMFCMHLQRFVVTEYVTSGMHVR